MPITAVTPTRIVLVALGGLLGSLVRHLATRGVDGIPWEVLAINLAGAVLAGFFVARMRRHARRARILVPLVVIGVAGALTTFSGLVVDSVLLADAGRWSDAAIYALASVVLGPMAAALGMMAGAGR